VINIYLYLLFGAAIPGINVICNNTISKFDLTLLFLCTVFYCIFSKKNSINKQILFLKGSFELQPYDNWLISSSDHLFVCAVFDVKYCILVYISLSQSMSRLSESNPILYWEVGFSTSEGYLFEFFKNGLFSL